LEINSSHVIASPTPERVAKMTAAINKALTTNTLEHQDAAQMAGKLGFLSTTMFGKLGRAPTKAVFGRQHSPSWNTKLTSALKAALVTLSHLLATARPRSRPLQSTDGHHSRVYTDAYFKMGDRRFSPSATDIPEEWSTEHCPDYENGWGGVVFPHPNHPELGYTVRGSVPPIVLRHFCSRKAYIYFLEAWALVLVTLAFSAWLDTAPLGFVDNEAAKFALIKGYSSDEAINAVIAVYWGHLHQGHRDMWLERVTSGANPSDETSRDEWQLATALGWRHLHLDTTKTHMFLLEALKHPEWIHSGLTEAMHRDLHQQLLPQMLFPPQ
jgi:hypothetical protein